ncbi:hypothetical protein PRIPAC_93164 [Pristionchus pacificus]|uniref:Uncharacterized protein n=1 Tax=Pristionchus pacificus TaxID=54126 RepID=A0A2A6BRN8_PRIPA|nr:hypothetical protein PRIPAC_93164 [Pristionchus pacificus]|eukprot:PDM68411.1 hypothetical protein PRIPAC_46455 [Pristionchus pacificus]
MGDSRKIHLLNKRSMYRHFLNFQSGQQIEMERMIRSLDWKRQQRVYDHFLVGTCEPYKAVIKSHENMPLPMPIKNNATPQPIVSVHTN